MKSSKRELLLSALLTNPTVREAAASVDVPETTAYNWLRNPDFVREYQQRKREAISEASSFLQSRISEATGIVCSIMRNEKVSPRTRLEACRTIFEYAYKAVEQEQIIQRIEALESSAMGDSGQ